jgi:cyclophilin family peptidyl-prolyl cis-trans isomerase/sugar phosphate isomerase/epimerase
MGRTGFSLLGVLMSIAMAGSASGEMKVGVRDGYLEGMDADTVWAAAKAVGIPSLEVVVTTDLACDRLFEGKEKPYRIDTPENRARLIAAARKNGCEIIGFCTVVALPKDGKEDWAVDWIEKVAKAAAEMKVPIVYMPLGGRDLPEQEFVARATAFLKRVAPIARATRVQLAIENLGPYLNKPEVLAPLLLAVSTDEVALMYDPANMYWFGYPRDQIYELVRIFAPFTRMLHAKNVKYPDDKRDVRREMGWEYMKYAEPVPAGDLDFGRIVGILVNSGFKGNIVIEDDSLPKKDAAGKKKALQDDAKALRELAGAQSKPAAGGSARPRVEFETSLGSFVVELCPDKTPITVANFLRYVDEGYYDGTIFHRVIPTFMIQGGGFTDADRQKFSGLHEPIRNEAKLGLNNKRGTIAMARTPDPHSATSQFFVNVADNGFLDAPGQDGWGYCAFGTVVSGMDTVDKIKNVPTSPGGERSQPVDPPMIKKARRAN